ncbi:MAG: cysteine hydrolase family protein [Lachnospiraceae bacterium]
MEHSYLIVVDMQNDFVTGALGSREAAAIVPSVVQKITQFTGTVLFTKDTHKDNYMETQEGKKLPVPHCIQDTDGWNLIPEIANLPQAQNPSRIFLKETFGSTKLAETLVKEHAEHPISSITLIGVCTDICVISNALLIKAFLPEVPIFVDAACCAGVTPQTHDAALKTMESCQICVSE